jgi:spore maturation protein CgeB
MQTLDIAVFGLSITSSWGNGHATTYRSLIKALAKRGHRITFFERDVPWYACHRDLPAPPFCKTILYKSVSELDSQTELLACADLIILGSYVQNADVIAQKVAKLAAPCFAFYDIDTPVTLAKLDRRDYEYLHPEMIPEFDLYLSFTGGPVLTQLEKKWGARRARPLYCSVDPSLYFPQNPHGEYRFALGYLGTYSEDRQPTLQKLLVEPALKNPESLFCVAGAQYPDLIQWPNNVELVEHIPPKQHCGFYNSQRFTLNVTRADMINAGYSPSVRLFEAGACGTPVISDNWTGLDSFFDIGREILVAQSSKDLDDFFDMTENDRLTIGKQFREKVLKFHTSDHRAMEIECHWQEAVAENKSELSLTTAISH